MVLQYNETVFRDTITITFDEDYRMAKLDRSVNVNSFSTRRPAVWGVNLITPESVKKLQCLPSSVAYSTTATTIGELLDSDATRAILEAEIPEVVKNPRIEQIRRYTFDVILHHIPGLTMQDLARIDAKLSALWGQIRYTRHCESIIAVGGSGEPFTIWNVHRAQGRLKD